MKKRLLVVCIAVLSATALWLLGALILDVSSVKDPVALYNTAISDSSIQKDLTLTIYKHDEISVANETFITESQQTLRRDTDSSSTLYLEKEERIISDTGEIKIHEIFANNQLFLTINDTPFLSEMEEKQYLSQSISPVILNASLYKTISGIRNDGIYTISFSNSTKPEEWIFKENMQNFTANGKAIIDQDGNLLSSEYHIEYAIGSVNYRTSLSVTISRENIAVILPTNPDDYTKIENVQGLIALETASDYLLQAKHISAQYSDTIYVQAMGDQRNQTVEIHTDTQNDLSVTVQRSISSIKDHQAGQPTDYKTVETFSEGQYAISTNDGKPIYNPDITTEQMRNYYQLQLVSTIMLPQYVTEVQFKITDTEISYIYILNDAFLRSHFQNACQILYGNPDILNDALYAISPEEFYCYLTLDKATHFPADSGIVCKGSYESSDNTYKLEYSAIQSYNIE